MARAIGFNGADHYQFCFILIFFSFWSSWTTSIMSSVFAMMCIQFGVFFFLNVLTIIESSRTVECSVWFALFFVFNLFIYYRCCYLWIYKLENFMNVSILSGYLNSDVYELFIIDSYFSFFLDFCHVHKINFYICLSILTNFGSWLNVNVIIFVKVMFWRAIEDAWCFCFSYGTMFSKKATNTLNKWCMCILFGKRI